MKRLAILAVACLAGCAPSSSLDAALGDAGGTAVAPVELRRQRRWPCLRGIGSSRPGDHPDLDRQRERVDR